MKRLLIPVCAILFAFAVACSSDGPPATLTPTEAIASSTPVAAAPALNTPAAPTPARPVPPTPQPVAAIIPPAGGVEGPVLVYRRDDAQPASIYAFDVGAQRELWAVPTTTGDGWLRVAKGGDALAIGTSNAVSLYRFDGTPAKEVLRREPGELFGDIALSPDARLLAIVRTSDTAPASATPITRWPQSLAIIELASGRELARLESSDPAVAGFAGEFGPLQWREDGRGVVMWGATNSDGKAGSNLSLLVDGRVKLHDVKGAAYFSPSGSLAFHGSFSLGCLFYSGHDWTVTNLDTGRTLATLSDPTRAFSGDVWSPDSRYFLVESRPWQEGLDCEEDRWWAATPDLLLIDTQTGAILPVPDLEALYRSWYGADLISVDCDGTFAGPGIHPFGNTSMVFCRNFEPATLHFGSTPVTTGKVFILLGVFD